MSNTIAGEAAVAGAVAGVVADATGLTTSAVAEKAKEAVAEVLPSEVKQAAQALADTAEGVKSAVVGMLPPVVTKAAQTAAKAAQAAAAELWAMYEYPPVAFYFYVSIAGNLFSDNSFQEVSGISSTIETEPLVEGGNQYVLNLPTKVSHSNLVLKRGSAAKDGSLVNWCKESVETDFYGLIQTKKVSVYLMNAMHIPIQGWDFFNAYPVKWEFEPFNSMENKVAIEKIELSYLYSARVIG